MSPKVYAPNVNLFAFHLQKSGNGTHADDKDKDWLWLACNKIIHTTLQQDFDLMQCLDLEKEPNNPTVSLIKVEKQRDEALIENGKIYLDGSSPLLIEGFAYPLRLYDSYGLRLNLRRPETEKNQRTEDVDIQIFSKLNPDNCLMLEGNDKLLAQSLIITAWLSSEHDPQDQKALKNLADECLKAFFSNKYPIPPFVRSATLFGSPIFEYGLFSQLTNYQHILVWFFRDAEADEKFNDYQEQLLDLFFFRAKVVKAFQKSREVYEDTNKKYQKIEDEINKLKEFDDTQLLIDEKLDRLSDKLKTLPQMALDYANLLRYLESYQNTIAINGRNYADRLQQIRGIVQDEDISFLEKFSLENSPDFQEQIKADLGYFTHGSSLLDKAIASIRGRVEIDRAKSDRVAEDKKERSDRNLQITILAVGTGIGAGGIMSSSYSLVEVGNDPILKALQTPVTNRFTASITYSLLFGFAVGMLILLVEKLRQWCKRRHNKPKITRFMLKVLPKQTVSMHTRDGVRLDADIYRPDADGEFPVLLMRQPYGRAIASTVVYAHPTWYAAHGYIVVIQDVRGRGTSEGEFKLFTHEITDGEDTVNWAANLPGSNGKVGMYGFSYQGMTQLYAAVNQPSALKTICPAMIGYDLYSDWAYEGGAFCLQTNLAWAIQLATETARLRGDKTAYQALFTASRNLPVTNPEILQQLAPDSFYHEWLAHSQPDEYWEQLSPKHHLQAVDLPMFHIGGWFDTYLRGTLHLYKDMAARSTTPQHLLVGAWAHLPWGRKVGEIDFGAKAASPVDKMQIRWFDQFLKGVDTGLLHESPVCLFEMGSNIWRSFPSLPIPTHKYYFLSTTGLASIREDSGTLTPNPQSPVPNTFDVLVHDPWRPVPALGGHAAIPAGVFERSHIDCRSDVLTYTSEPLGEDLHLAGDVAVEIWCTADQPSYDLCAVLSQVHPDGRVYNLTQGYVHCRDFNVSTKIQLQPTCARIAKGNALRLSLSAACFPAYAMNSGNGAVTSSESLRDAQIITLTVNCGGEFNSHILLPVVSST